MPNGEQLKLLDSFNLEQHGDRREREWWPLIKENFPAYEAFWRLFVVPLTNRVIPEISISDPNWIRVRPSVSDRYMKLAMAHYSVFYCVARARKRLSEADVAEYPEDVIYLLRASGENAGRFLKLVCDMGKDCGTHLPLPDPHQFPKDYDGVFTEIKDYRDSLLHYPVLGRASTVRQHLLPSHSRLSQIREDWRKAELLPLDDLVNAQALVARLATDNTRALQQVWTTIIKELGSSTAWEKMASATGLHKLLASVNKTNIPSVFSSTAASGTFFKES